MCCPVGMLSVAWDAFDCLRKKKFAASLLLNRLIRLHDEDGNTIQKTHTM